MHHRVAATPRRSTAREPMASSRTLDGAPVDAENSRLSSDLHWAQGDDVGVAKTAPGWFVKAVETPIEHGSVTVDGARIRYLLWNGAADKPGIVLVHGNGAHAHWWTFIAPFLLEHYRVA